MIIFFKVHTKRDVASGKNLAGEVELSCHIYDTDVGFRVWRFNGYAFIYLFLHINKKVAFGKLGERSLFLASYAGFC